MKLIDRAYFFRGLLVPVLLSIFLFIPFPVVAAPHVLNALPPDRGEWRDYYRDKFLADLHGFTVESTLNEYSTTDPKIKEAIKLRLEGHWKESIDLLGSLVVDPENSNVEEAVYISGLVYESIAFFPEAMGNYARIEFSKEEAKGEFYYKTILRKSYVKFLTGLKYSRILSMIDADGGFYKVFNNSTDTLDWRDALAGHAMMLYFFGAHENAEEIFESVAEYGPLRSAYLLARAENYMNLGLHQEARVAFQDLLVSINNSERPDLLAYMYLRLGDIANIRDEQDDAKVFYELITPVAEKDEEVTEKDEEVTEEDGEVTEEDGEVTEKDGESSEEDEEVAEKDKEPIFNDPYIMQAMAVGEYYMKAGKNAKAIGIFRLISNGPFPIGLDLRETVALNMVLLYDRDSLEAEAFISGKNFILLYPENPYIKEVWRIINDHIYKLIADGREKSDFNNVLYYYFENIGFIKEKRTLLIVGEVLMDMGFPQEANDVFAWLWKRHPSYLDIDVLSGLARSSFMLERRNDAAVLLKRARPRKRAHRTKLAETWRLLGDDYYRKGESKGALHAYAQARKVISDEVLDLKYAKLLTSARKGKEAVDIYKGLLKRALSTEFKGKVYLEFAECYFSLRDWRRALTNYHFALKSAPKLIQGEIHYKIGEVNFAMGKDALAVAAWKMAIDTDEQGYYKKLARVRIREVRIWKSTLM